MTPTGIVLVFIDEKGHAIAHAADFEASEQWVQRSRAKRMLAFAVCNAYASRMLTRGLDAMDAERIVDQLCRMHGCSIHEVVLGQEAEK